MNGEKIPDLSFLKPPAKTVESPTCAGCRFMVVDDKNMVCRRRPPTSSVLIVQSPVGLPRMIGGRMQQEMRSGPQPFTAWPIVRPDWWCAEHTPAFRAVEIPMATGADIRAQHEELKRMEIVGPHPSLVPRMEGDDRGE